MKKPDYELFIGYVALATIIYLVITAEAKSWSYKWSGKGKLYDQRNQYFVTCRLTKKKVEPFFGETLLNAIILVVIKKKWLSPHTVIMCVKDK